MKNFLYSVFLITLLPGHVQTTSAEELLMARSQQPFSETMLALQDAIREKGYKLSRIQRVDIGLTKSGFRTDKYRIAFFGKPEQIRKLSMQFPETIPYLPLKIAIFAENEETLLVSANPAQFRIFFDHADLVPVFSEWERDLRAIFEEIRQTE